MYTMSVLPIEAFARIEDAPSLLSSLRRCHGEKNIRKSLGNGEVRFRMISLSSNSS